MSSTHVYIYYRAARARRSEVGRLAAALLLAAEAAGLARRTALRLREDQRDPAMDVWMEVYEDVSPGQDLGSGLERTDALQPLTPFLHGPRHVETFHDPLDVLVEVTAPCA